MKCKRQKHSAPPLLWMRGFLWCLQCRVVPVDALNVGLVHFSFALVCHIIVCFDFWIICTACLSNAAYTKIQQYVRRTLSRSIVSCDYARVSHSRQWSRPNYNLSRACMQSVVARSSKWLRTKTSWTWREWLGDRQRRRLLPCSPAEKHRRGLASLLTRPPFAMHPLQRDHLITCRTPAWQ